MSHQGTTQDEQVEHRELVWLDCDPGHDDAIAIILAGHSSRIQLLGISTICGNQTVEKTTQNALKMLSISGLGHIDVVKGQEKAIVRPARACPEIHGNTGLDGTDDFPEITKKELPYKAVLYMRDVIEAQERPVTIVGTAQLTNIALLLTLFPEIKAKLKQIVILGGAIGFGNISPAAEWNIMCDPEAAKIVFDAGSSDFKVVLIPIEVTHTALVKKEILTQIANMETPYSKLIVELLTFFEKTYREVFQFEFSPLHDPCAVCYVIDSSLFKTKLMRVDVECNSSMCDGRTLCDLYNVSSKEKNVHVAVEMNVPKFWDHVLDAMKKANSKSCMNTKKMQ